MSYPEYEAHIRSRRDYARIARKDGSGERQVTGHGHRQPAGRTTGWGGCEEDPSAGFVGLRGARKTLALPPGLQVAFVQKRFHKDIFPNPVLMLNFCPAVEPIPGDLQSVTREVLFLVDRSGTMSGPDVDKVKVRRGSEGWGLSPSGGSLAALPVPGATPGSSAGGPEEPPVGDPAQHRRLRLRGPAALPLQPPLQQRECCRGKRSPRPPPSSPP